MNKADASTAGGALFPAPPTLYSLLGKPTFLYCTKITSQHKEEGGKDPKTSEVGAQGDKDRIKSGMLMGEGPPSPLHLSSIWDAEPIPHPGSPELAFPLFQDSGISQEPCVFLISNIINPEQTLVGGS